MEQKEKEFEQLQSKQVEAEEELSRHKESLQKFHETANLAQSEHRQQLQNNDKYCSQLESRLKDLNNVIKTKNSELKNYQMTLENIEVM